ncbi:divalent-cation tolerance protein CutA [Candidatus Woesearchaeota archaeon]|nr:divalent-cation tolerance protein CutA [Candidatus Woesearchaeota archaeon]
MILVYVTYPSNAEARKIVTHLLKKRFIACATFFPVQSAYWWKGKIEQSTEYVSLCKTTEQNWKKIQEEVKKLHSYAVPCILKLKADANISYLSWLSQELK